MSFLLQHPALVAAYTLQHVAITITALAIALALAFPLAILAARYTRVETPLLGFLGAVYTVPSLALLAILVHYEGLGFWTLVTALIAYAQFILVRNFATGLREVPAAQKDAATGLGMSASQRLWRVEFPQALKIMLGGVRIATISLIAIATLGGWIGAGGLGELIFAGIRQDYIQKTIAGSVASAVLAVAADLVLRSFEKRAHPE
ncbi:MAG: ABC transporter permease subunit [Candidatus Eremiobacteraeota bacterium]|nr:ABC transporter permease subunit [Candidatus Eremiobacteraeota bacterium]